MSAQLLWVVAALALARELLPSLEDVPPCQQRVEGRGVRDVQWGAFLDGHAGDHLQGVVRPEDEPAVWGATVVEESCSWVEAQPDARTCIAKIEANLVEEGGNFTWNVFVSRMQSTSSTSSSVARPGNKLTNWLRKNDKVLKLLQKVKTWL